MLLGTECLDLRHQWRLRAIGTGDAIPDRVLRIGGWMEGRQPGRCHNNPRWPQSSIYCCIWNQPAVNLRRSFGIAIEANHL